MSNICITFSTCNMLDWLKSFYGMETYQTHTYWISHTIEGPHIWRRTPLFSPRLTTQITTISPICWRTMKEKNSTLPSPAECVCHSSSYSSARPEILPSTPPIFPCPLTLFPFFSHFFSFLLRLLSNQFFLKTSKKKRFN